MSVELKIVRISGDLKVLNISSELMKLSTTKVLTQLCAKNYFLIWFNLYTY